MWVGQLLNGEFGRRPLGYLTGAMLAALAAIILIQFTRHSGKTWKDGPLQGMGFCSRYTLWDSFYSRF